MRRISKEFLGTHLKVEQLPYIDYVLSKGSLSLNLSNLEPSHLIEKRGRYLYIGEEEIDLRHRSMGSVLDLIREYSEDISIKIEYNFPLRMLDCLSALYLADFSSRAFRVFDLDRSYIPLKRIETFKDRLGSTFSLEDFEVEKKYSKKKKDSFKVLDKIEVEDFEDDLQIKLEYRATDLNIYTLHEIPLSTLGLEGITLFEGQ